MARVLPRRSRPPPPLSLRPSHTWRPVSPAFRSVSCARARSAALATCCTFRRGRGGAGGEGRGAPGARPCGMDALEGRRVEVGVPRIGPDMGEKTLALEVPVEDAISITKGCYLGQEVVARGTARGHVNRRLEPLVLTGPAPGPGATLVRDGKDVGLLTTVARAFGAGTLAALGFVRREHWEVGTELSVRGGHAVTIARVATWPLA